MRFRFRFILFTLISLFSFVSAASSVDLLHILRPKTDLLVRLDIINNAKDHVFYVSYHHDSSDSTLLVLESLRLAALRGVKVHYIYDKVATGTQGDVSTDYLGALQKAGVQIKAVTIVDRLLRWGPFKIIHSKLLLADSVGGKDVLLSGGRNGGDIYINWLDNSFLFRGESGDELVSTARGYYERIWSSLRKVKFKLKRQPKEKMYGDTETLMAAAHEKYGSVTVTNEMDGYRKFLLGVPNRVMPEFHFKSGEVEFISSNLVDKIYGRTRNNQLEAAVAELVGESSRVDISTIFLYLSEETRAVLSNFLAQGRELNVLTNSIDSYGSVMGNNKGFAAATLNKIQRAEIEELSRQGRITAWEFEISQLIYHHTKFLIGDHSVLLTSSNTNQSSDVNSEEIAFLIKSPEFVKYMRAYSADIERRFFRRVEYKNGHRLNLLEKSCRFVFGATF